MNECNRVHIPQIEAVPSYADVPHIVAHIPAHQIIFQNGRYRRITSKGIYSSCQIHSKSAKLVKWPISNTPNAHTGLSKSNDTSSDLRIISSEANKSTSNTAISKSISVRIEEYPVVHIGEQKWRRIPSGNGGIHPRYQVPASRYKPLAPVRRLGMVRFRKLNIVSLKEWNGRPKLQPLAISRLDTVPEKNWNDRPKLQSNMLARVRKQNAVRIRQYWNARNEPTESPAAECATTGLAMAKSFPANYQVCQSLSISQLPVQIGETIHITHKAGHRSIDPTDPHARKSIVIPPQDVNKSTVTGVSDLDKSEPTPSLKARDIVQSTSPEANEFLEITKKLAQAQVGSEKLANKDPASLSKTKTIRPRPSLPFKRIKLTSKEPSVRKHPSRKPISKPHPPYYNLALKATKSLVNIELSHSSIPYILSDGQLFSVDQISEYLKEAVPGIIIFPTNYAEITLRPVLRNMYPIQFKAILPESPSDRNVKLQRRPREAWLVRANGDILEVVNARRSWLSSPTSADTRVIELEDSSRRWEQSTPDIDSMVAEAHAMAEIGTVNWLHKLSRYRAANPAHERDIVHKEFGAGYCRCTIKIPEARHKFGDSAIFKRISNAEQFCAKRAVDWLISNGYLPQDGSMRWPNPEWIRAYRTSFKDVTIEEVINGSVSASPSSSPIIYRDSTKRRIIRVMPERMMPDDMLDKWLSTDSITEKCQVWEDSRPLARRWYLNFSMILLDYLHESLINGQRIAFSEPRLKYLKQHLYSVEDVASWAQAVTVPDRHKRLEHFLSPTSNLPIFLLSPILREPITKVKMLDRILTNVSERITNITRTKHRTIGPPQRHTMITVQILLKLLCHARKIWPSAVIKITRILINTVVQFQGKRSKRLDDNQRRELCNVMNNFLSQLSIPADTNSFEAMAYSWNAQKLLLEWAGQFKPTLLLNQRGYQAVSRVLAAQKKNERESRVSSLGSRSWPPWRTEQDGMDAQRPLVDDLSRAVLATMRMTESGFQESPRDKALRILGGQEPDGTPTVHTRKLRWAPHVAHMDISDLNVDSYEWVARVEATRDVQEAWSAFTKFRDSGGHPGYHLYFAMFEKLHFEQARLNFDRTSHGSKVRYLMPVPGAGKEVLPPSNDNFSAFYRTSLQPPSMEDLYKMMLKDGILPQARFLRFLVAHARTPDQAITYLLDSPTDLHAVKALLGATELEREMLQGDTLPPRLFAAFLQMCCRFVPRFKEEYKDPNSPNNKLTSDGSSHNTVLQLENSWTDLLSHAIKLLKNSKTGYRPAWYAVLRALARRGTIVDQALVGNSENDVQSWQIMRTVVDNFYMNNLEFDSYGFLILCHGLEKSIVATLSDPDQKPLALDSQDVRFIKEEFLKITALSESADSNNKSPLHDIQGVHLHAYVRVVGLVSDYEAIIRVVEFMRQHQVHLNEGASQSRNGPLMIERTLIAVRIFTSGTDYETLAETIVSEFASWPSEADVHAYIIQGKQHPEYADDDFDFDFE